ncbi:MAG: hypothetical protein M0R17_08080 [Candidatus Omnitrophica bacterium]|jgi:hypothetical protein|nr:hypothetical protein [Candidatus Omnitrophota bacterium]
MKTGETINEGTILVAIATQSTACGVKYIHTGSIVKVARETPDWREDIKVYRNQKEEREDDWKYIDRSKVRLATPGEEELWKNNVSYLKYLKVN